MKTTRHFKCFEIHDAIQQGINEFHRQAGYSVAHETLKTKPAIKLKKSLKTAFVFLVKIFSITKINLK